MGYKYGNYGVNQRFKQVPLNLCPSTAHFANSLGGSLRAPACHGRSRNLGTFKGGETCYTTPQQKSRMGMFPQKWGKSMGFAMGLKNGRFRSSFRPYEWCCSLFSFRQARMVNSHQLQWDPGASLKLPWFVGLHVVCWWTFFSSAKSDIFQSLFDPNYQFQLVNQMAVMIQGSSFIVKTLWLKHVKPWLLF